VRKNTFSLNIEKQALSREDDSASKERLKILQERAQSFRRNVIRCSSGKNERKGIEDIKTLSKDRGTLNRIVKA
jgi:hypothetical protein